MRSRITALVVCLVVLLGAGVLITAVARVREAATRTQCHNNARSLALAVHNYHGCYGSFPHAALPNDALSCERRLSWLVDIVPFADQMYLGIDRTKAWNDESNLVPATREYHPGPDGELTTDWTLEPLGEVRYLRCPANPAMAGPDAPGLTDYVGVAGLGADAAWRARGYPGTGVFGCDRQTRFEDVKDGLATTLLLIETARDNGPWTAAGSATVRGLDTAAGPYLGQGGQFASNHPGGGSLFASRSACVTHAAFADGSVRGLAASLSPLVFEALATVAGGEEVALPGDG